MTPQRMQGAARTAQASIARQGVTKQNPVRTVRGPSTTTTTPVKMGPTRNKPMVKAMDNVVKEADNAGKKALFKGKGKGLAIGLGAAVIGGLAYSGRRGEGSSGGRAGMSRY